MVRIKLIDNTTDGMPLTMIVSRVPIADECVQYGVTQFYVTRVIQMANPNVNVGEVWATVYADQLIDDEVTT